MKPLRVPSEICYLLSILVLSFAVAMVAAAGFGVSMIVAPAYILSLKVPFLTFGQSEYIVQAILFAVFCALMGRVKLVYFSSFLTCLLYGAVLDLWRAVIPLLNPAVTAPGSMAMPVRIALFTGGMLLTAVSVALVYRAYLYPQVYDFFVKGVSARFSLNRTKFKIAFDVGSLLVAVAMTLLFFHRFNGIGVGTLIMTAFNGLLIGAFGKVFDRFFTFPPLLPSFAAQFAIEAKTLDFKKRNLYNKDSSG